MSQLDNGNGNENIKFKELTLEEVLPRFDRYKQNNFYKEFTETLEDAMTAAVNPWRIYAKDKNLPRLLAHLRKRGDLPLVDAETGLVIVPRAHQFLCAALFVLKTNTSVTPREILTTKRAELGRQYIGAGLGYYWTGESQSLVVNTGAYHADTLDTEAWKLAEKF